MFVAVAAHEISIAPEGSARATNRVGNTTKLLVLVTSPCGVRMVVGPSVASGGTVAVIRRSRLVVDALVNTVPAPLNRTPVAPVKFLPKRVTRVPGIPVAGSKLVKPGPGVGYQ